MSKKTKQKNTPNGNKSNLYGPPYKRSLRWRNGAKHALSNIRNEPWLVITTPIRVLRSLFSFKTLKLVTLRTLKYATITCISVMLLLSFSFLLASLIFDEEDINRNLSKLVRDATGAEIHVKTTNLDLFSGITFEGVTLHASKQELEANSQPLLIIDGINIHWDFLSLFILQAELKSASIINPQIYLKQFRDARWNFTPMLEHLKANAEQSPKDPTGHSQKDPEDTSNDAALKISDILPIHPRNLLLMPFYINARNIGFKNLRIELLEESSSEASGKIAQKTTIIDGLNTAAAINWLGNESNIALRLFSNPESDLNINLTEDETASLDAKISLDQIIEIKNLDRIKFGVDLNVQHYKTPQVSLEDLPASIDIRAGLIPSLKGIDVKALNIEMLNVLGIHTEGEISFLDDRIDQYQVAIDQDIAIDLSHAGKLLKQLHIPVELSGKINLPRTAINGTLKPNQITEELAFGSIPRLDMQVRMYDVSCRIAEQNIALLPTNGKLNISYDAIPGKNGIELDISNNLHISGANVSQRLDYKETKITIEDLNQTLAARVSYPDIVVPFIRLTTDIAKIQAELGKEPPIKTPLNLEVFASTTAKQEKVTLDAKVELEELLDLNIDLSCRNHCNKIKLSQSLQMDNFNKLYAFIKPIIAKTTPLQFVPENISGKLNISTQIKSNSKNIQEENVEKLVQNTDGKVQFDLSLSKLSTKIPFKKIALKDFTTGIHLAGTFKQQNLEFTTNFDDLGVDLDDSDKPKRATINHLNFETDITNNTDLAEGFAKITENLITELKSNLYIGQIHLDQILPKPINSFALAVDTKQTNLKKFEIKDISLKAPDFGAKIQLSGNTHLSHKMLPESLGLSTNIEIEHAGGEGLASGIKTAGKMLMKAEIQTDDMKLFKIRGKSSFDQFDLTIPDPDPNKSPLVLVEKINGDLPLYQAIDISPYFNINDFANPNEPPTDTKSSELQGSEPQGQEISEQVIENSPEQTSPRISALEKYYENTKSKVAESTNLVSHADFLAVKNLYPENKTLSIKRVSAANLTLSDMEFDIEVKQNWFSLSQFSINFLGGKIQGDVKLAFNPMPDRFMTSIHLTRLNTTKLLENFPNLKGKSTSWDLFSDPYLDMNIHLDYDIKQNDMGGGIDITRIGKEQLKMMLFYLDPEEQNPSLAYVRTALNFGDISGVSIPIKSGFIGFDVGVTFLAVPIPLPKLDRFPISELISNLQTDKKPPEKASENAKEPKEAS